jgi:hypothetical protein
MTSFTYDDLCMLHDLKTQSILNGRAVRVCLPSGKIADDRVPVQLMIGGKRLSVKPVNLFNIDDMKALSLPYVASIMPDADKNDCGMYFFSMEGSTRIAPGVTLMSTRRDSDADAPRCTSPSRRRPERGARKPSDASLSPSTPLTDEEKTTALSTGLAPRDRRW